MAKFFARDGKICEWKTGLRLEKTKLLSIYRTKYKKKTSYDNFAKTTGNFSFKILSVLSEFCVCVLSTLATRERAKCGHFITKTFTI